MTLAVTVTNSITSGTVYPIWPHALLPKCPFNGMYSRSEHNTNFLSYIWHHHTHDSQNKIFSKDICSHHTLNCVFFQFLLHLLSKTHPYFHDHRFHNNGINKGATPITVQRFVPGEYFCHAQNCSSMFVIFSGDHQNGWNLTKHDTHKCVAWHHDHCTNEPFYTVKWNFWSCHGYQQQNRNKGISWQVAAGDGAAARQTQ